MTETLECRLNSTQNKSKNETSNLAGTFRNEDTVIMGNDPKSSCKPLRFEAITKDAYEAQKPRTHKYRDIFDEIMKAEGKYFRIQSDKRNEITALFNSFTKTSKEKKLNLILSTRKDALLIHKP